MCFPGVLQSHSSGKVHFSLLYTAACPKMLKNARLTCTPVHHTVHLFSSLSTVGNYTTPCRSSLVFLLLLLLLNKEARGSGVVGA